MSNKLVIFDIDGTLLTMWPVHEKVYASVINEIYNVPDVNFRRFYKPGDSNKEIVRTNLEHLGYDAEFITRGLDRIPEAMGRYYDRYVRAEDITILPGALRLLKALGEADTPMSVMTGNNLPTANLILTKAELIGFFKAIAAADDGTSREERLLAAIRFSELKSDMKFDISNVFYIDDSDHSIPVSRKMGITSVAVATGEVSYEQLKAAKPNYLFKNLEDTKTIMRVLEPNAAQTKSRST